ncbi:head decoration protein [Leucobacter sp. cx-42]|uniref:head decoration protein n=1 Tax=unclassified Leucobacter TaxID=2621730 RepID=UPI00165E208E|nr:MULTISPECIES: head decoration protein [unclassified Leucobacter]MBC9954939.1 head decoration protein [Leucobacter sp. cx-42]
MTSLNAHVTEFQAEDRSWLRGPHGVGAGATPSATLLVALFDKTQHYPNGFIPSGIVLGKVTATGVHGPYDPAADDGRQVAAGLLFGSLTVNGDRLGGAIVTHAFVTAERLPVESGTGSLDAAARTALSQINFN